MNNFIKTQFSPRIMFNFMFVSRRLRDVVFRLILWPILWFGIMVFIGIIFFPNADATPEWLGLLGVYLLFIVELTLFFGYLYGLSHRKLRSQTK